MTAVQVIDNQIAVAQVVVARENNESIKQENPYIKQFLHWFLVERGRSKRSADAYKWELEKFFAFLKSHEEKINIGKVTKFQVREYLTTLDELSASTRERAVSCLKSFFRFLLVEGYIPSNPMETIYTPVIRKKVPNFFSKKQCLKLTDYLEKRIEEIEDARGKIIQKIIEYSGSGFFLEHIILLLIVGGLSKSQIINLKFSDCKTKTGKIILANKESITLPKNQRKLFAGFLKAMNPDFEKSNLNIFESHYKFENQIPSKSDLLRKLDFSSDNPEWETLLKSIDPATLEWAYRDQAIIVLLLSTGIRRIELSNLTIKNVDLKDATITVTRKGGDQQVIELNNDSVYCLEQYLKLRDSKEKSLFVSSKNKKMTPESLHYIVKKIISDCGLKGSAHTLRHTFVTELVRAGVPLPVIQSLVGHRNANTTIRYTHIISKDRRSAVSKINLGLKKTN